MASRFPLFSSRPSHLPGGSKLVAGRAARLSERFPQAPSGAGGILRNIWPPCRPCRHRPAMNCEWAADNPGRGTRKDAQTTGGPPMNRPQKLHPCRANPPRARLPVSAFRFGFYPCFRPRPLAGQPDAEIGPGFALPERGLPLGRKSRSKKNFVPVFCFLNKSGCRTAAEASVLHGRRTWVFVM